ncbi:glutamate-5-semialdehyde dehydrogenase, partial [bacterium]|nr:glutamate-5-semialdehyde dehydrogenase [bacterium]
TLKIVADADEAAVLFNRFSPQFVVSFLAESEENAARFLASINAPFVGNG